MTFYIQFKGVFIIWPRGRLFWRHDVWHKDTRPNWFSATFSWTFYSCAECRRYAKSQYVDNCCSECHCAECRFALSLQVFYYFTKMSLSWISLFRVPLSWGIFMGQYRVFDGSVSLGQVSFCWLSWQSFSFWKDIFWRNCSKGDEIKIKIFIFLHFGGFRWG